MWIVVTINWNDWNRHDVDSVDFRCVCVCFGRLSHTQSYTFHIVHAHVLMCVVLLLLVFLSCSSSALERTFSNSLHTKSNNNVRCVGAAGFYFRSSFTFAYCKLSCSHRCICIPAICAEVFLCFSFAFVRLKKKKIVIVVLTFTRYSIYIVVWTEGLILCAVRKKTHRESSKKKKEERDRCAFEQMHYFDQITIEMKNMWNESGRTVHTFGSIYLFFGLKLNEWVDRLDRWLQWKKFYEKTKCDRKQSPGISVIWNRFADFGEILFGINDQFSTFCLTLTHRLRRKSLIKFLFATNGGVVQY